MAQASSIIFGSMRMTPERADLGGWAALLLHLHDHGVRALHSSHEYDSFDLFCAALQQVARERPGTAFRHIVKLAEPSFDDDRFDPNRLAAAIDRYRSALGTDVVHDVQWMWRRGLADEPRRLAELADQRLAIMDAFAALKSDGRIERGLCFPYTTGCAALMLDDARLDGLVVYRNAVEREFDSMLDRCSADGRTVTIIRPFLGGQTLTDAASGTPRQQLDAALDHPAIEAAIISLSSMQHFDALIGCP